jgi:hypothetical protein
MQVIGQHHDRIDLERVRPPRRPEGGAQSVGVLDQHARSSIRERRRKEVRSAFDEIPPVSDHA